MSLSGFNRRIQWRENFTERTSSPNGLDAYTHAIWNLNPESYDAVQSRGTWKAGDNFNVVISMPRTQSWYVAGKNTAALLKHEQGHYDITALGAREINRRAVAVRAESAQEVYDAISAIMSEVQQKINDVNIRYDDRTDHSNIVAAQSSWEHAINAAKRLDEGTLDSMPV